MVTAILDHVERCYTSSDGDVILRLLVDALPTEDKVVISFKGVGDVPSSFVNAAFVPLLDYFSMDYIKRHLVITDSNRQINNMILDRMRFVAEQKKAG
jgi:2C-methyl-D-erythritol 2,4-cyclodiphosphate synthase